MDTSAASIRKDIELSRGPTLYTGAGGSYRTGTTKRHLAAEEIPKMVWEEVIELASKDWASLIVFAPKERWLAEILRGLSQAQSGDSKELLPSPKDT